MRFRVVPSDGQPFIHEQDKPLRASDTFFHLPREGGTHGFFKVPGVQSGDEETDGLIRGDRLDSLASRRGQWSRMSLKRIGWQDVRSRG